MTVTADPTTTRTNQPLLAARVFAGLVASIQAFGVTYFVILAPEEGVWLGPWIDYPVLAALLTVIALKVALAVGPRLDVPTRIRVGLWAVALGTGLTLVKIRAYDEPEGVTFLVLEAVLLALLLRARRTAAR